MAKEGLVLRQMLLCADCETAINDIKPSMPSYDCWVAKFKILWRGALDETGPK
ncbi:MAG: hypothetical protein KGZ50_07800 [Peptococcaceae bacterium]|nr:hypothetical protein [Peptococcaceae bacterium]